jgi:hypothetical protein
MQELLFSAFLHIAVILFSSILMILSLAYANQSWIRSRHTAISIVLLPIITYGITYVISGNIALSLGLVGALSIVRFRNPVKSPLELTAFFAAISYGIMATHSIYWPLLISLAVSSTVLIIHFLNYWLKKYLNYDMLSYSFSEGESAHSIELTGFTQSFIDNIISLDKNIAISLTASKNEENNTAFISSNNKILIEKIYDLSKNEVNERTMNIGL